MRLRRTIGLSLALLVVSAAFIARQAHSAQHQPDASAKEKHAKADAAAAKRAKTDASKDKRLKTDSSRAKLAKGAHADARADSKPRPAGNRHPSGNEPSRRPSAGSSSAPDHVVGALEVVGAQETGSAAWYGPRHIGHRTASGDRLDTIRATAAHRSLPLNSLARVTNLKNGRSVIVKVTDRGPWGGNRLIDVSPKAAQELDMKRAGIVSVRVEPVVLAKPTPQLASGESAGAD